MRRSRTDGFRETSGKHPADSGLATLASNKQGMKKWMPFWIMGGGILLVARSISLLEAQKSNISLDAHRDEEERVPGSSSQSKGMMNVLVDLVEPPLIDDSNVQYHIVFSTGCSLFQDWQSFVFFYQAMIAKQVGTITRIVSGCSDDDQIILQKRFDDQIVPMAPSQFAIHFTPDYSAIKAGKQYVYFNKPFGMRHWLENKLGFPDHPLDPNAIIILMDPDQLILRPFASNNFSNTQWIFTPKGQEIRTRIEHGKPMGQFYAFDLLWKYEVNMSVVAPNEQSPIDSMTDEEARSGYMVGPPYVATARDMYKIVTKWCDFAIPVHNQYPRMLAEMFAYCLSAAHQGFAHQTASSFMVSAVENGKEGWLYVDRLPEEEVYHARSVEDLPNVIHYCQRYGVGKFFFGKKRIPEKFLSCESALLKEPTKDDLATNKAIFPDGTLKEWSNVHAKRHRFMLCHLISIVNAAGTYFKQHHCDQSKANYSKSLVFHENMTMPEV